MEPSFSDNTMMAERHEENLQNNFGKPDGEGGSAIKESIVNHDNGRDKAVSLFFSFATSTNFKAEYHKRVDFGQVRYLESQEIIGTIRL